MCISRIQWIIYLLLLAGIGFVAWMFLLHTSTVTAPSTSEVSINDRHELELQVPLEKTVDLRKAFATEVQTHIASKKDFDLRSIYESYIDKIGANGMITEIQRMDPVCHFEGHDLGKVIFEKIGTIGESLTICQDACYSGCMHGVFMEAFKKKQEEYLKTHPAKPGEDPEDREHINMDVVKESIPSICEDPSVSSSYRPGDCAHGVGHAVTYLANDDWKKAIETCNLFTNKKLAYYCASGAYMEYVTIKGASDIVDPTKSLFYPCDQGEYPAACFFSKVGDAIRATQAKGGKSSDVIRACLKLPGLYQLGCFHGFGNAYIGPLQEDKLSIKDLCANGSLEDRQMCIEGAMMRIGKYAYEKGQTICSTQLEGVDQKICLDALSQRMYGLDRPFERYLN
ncbi:MAG: hypothetical protein NTX72_06205 [Candidatus Uhrbacteria bacterium]|nr:hypothetical protein [Candidatus Uhrbacteria bacterium]